MATVVKPAVFIKSFGCHVQPPQEPEYLTMALPPKTPQDADAIVVEFCDLESAVRSKAMGVQNGQEKLLLNWADAKGLCYAILKAAAETGDEVSRKCLQIIDTETQNAS
jgi:hypothetical protein